jgi:hypothetical protein
MALNDSFQVYNIVSDDLPTVFCYNAGADSLATVSAASYFDSLLYRVRTGDKVLIKTSTSGLSYSGTFRNNGTNVFVDWDNTLRFQTQMADVSAASTAWIGVPPAGVITQVYGVLWSAVTVASSTVTFSIGASAITGGALTVTTAGAAGQVYTATPTALNITDGTTAVKAVSDGGSTTTAIMTLGFKIICPAQI